MWTEPSGPGRCDGLNGRSEMMEMFGDAVGWFYEEWRNGCIGGGTILGLVGLVRGCGGG